VQPSTTSPDNPTSPAGPDMSRASRLTAYSAVSTSLSLLSDHQVAELVGGARKVGVGIGGAAAVLEVEGRTVFVKRVALTDLERRPENVRSTANVFQLPTFSQYGVGFIGGAGFGAWRELAVHTMTTNWVLDGESGGFPLMYHWRVLPEPGWTLPAELADVDRAVEYWEGSAAVRARIEAVGQATASIALFLEYIPQNLHKWLADRIAEGGQAAESACTMVEQELKTGTAFMNARGLLHFDAHFENILTDGLRLYFADYGLAISSRFDLSEAEAEFFRRHEAYDRCYALTHLFRWLAVELCPGEQAQREVFVRDCIEGRAPDGVPAAAVAIFKRYKPIADIMVGFYRRFQSESRTAPYPAEEISQLLYGYR
jgi:hypothetical protein